MKIQYRKGDVFSTEIKLIAHGCNSQGVMGSGVARTVREQFPFAYEKYVKVHQTQGLKLGQVISVPDNGKIIANAITQEFFGANGDRFVSYDAVAQAMARIERMNVMYGIEEVAMPQIGAGLGGGDWNVIAAIIESELKSIQPVVYIFE